MCVPILYEDVLFGAMYVDSRTKVEAFRQRDLGIFSVIATQFGVALHSAQLLQRVREETKNRTQLARFLSPNLVQQVLSGQVSMARLNIELKSKNFEGKK